MADTATVAVLFCDLVSSTERQSRLGDDAADDFRRRFFAALRAPLRVHGGHEIKNLGDGIMATFESTTGALLSANAMHEEVTHLDPDDPVLLRIGVSVGEVRHEDADWFGTPVVEAARLCAVAPAGQTLATGVVRTVVGSRGARLRFTDAGPMQLKGLPAPIAVVSVDELDPDRPPPTPPTATAAPPPSGSKRSPRRSTTSETMSTPVRTRRRRRAVTATIAGLAVIGGSVWAIGAGGGDGDDGEQSVVATTEATTRPAGYDPSYRTVDCRPEVATDVPGAECGQLIVPEDRDQPLSRKIHVDVTRAPALGAATSPPVLLVDVNEPLGTSPLRDHADVYAVTLRGFSPLDEPRLNCPGLQEVWRQTLAVAPDDAGAIERRRAAATACADELRATGVQLEGYTMAEVADDLRDLVIERRLGKVAVAASGFSTTAAVQFARTDRGRVESMLLTNPTPPGASILADPTQYLSKSFDQVASLSAADQRCVARFGDDLRSEFEHRVDEYEAHPRLVSTTPLSPGQAGVDVLLDGRRMGAALAAAMMASGQVALVPSAISPNGVSPELLAAAAVNDDLRYYAGDDALAGTILSYFCSYDARLNLTSEVADAALPHFAGANNPTLQPLSAAWDVPVVTERLSQPLSGDLPVLLAEGGLSAAGVNHWAEQMEQSLPNATVVRLPTLSEDLSYVQPACLHGIRAAFVAHPDAKPKVSACDHASPPVEFVGR